MNSAVFITGVGIISAIGHNRDEVRHALLKGNSCIGPLRFLSSKHKGLPCGEVKLSNQDLCAMLDIPSTEEDIYNRTALLGIEAIRQALKQSGNISDEAYLISGTTVGGMDRTEQHFLDMLEKDDYLDLLRTHDSGATTKLMSAYWGIKASHTLTVSTACSSASNAIIVGADMIRTGKADVVIAGGSESLSLFHLNGFRSLMILDAERCRLFDDSRKGLNLGEGAAFVVLESLSSVAERGVKPLAVLSGYGNSCDAFHQTASSPNGDGAYLAMKKALEMEGLTPEDIDYVTAHGTGTPNNDASESTALKRIFMRTVPPVSSTKPFTGHATSAAGSIELVISLLALLDGFIPANLGWKHPIPGGIIPVSKLQTANLKHIMSNSFGFGGNDASLIISKSDKPIEDVSDEKQRKSVHFPSSVFTLATKCSAPGTSLDALKLLMSPMATRRLCALLKSAMWTSLSVLRDAGIETPDAIIIGTSYGMLENSEKFLYQMCREGEDGLSPTLFMQSTHNTIAGTLAVHTHCHGYNITYTDTDADRALELCQHNAEILMQQGRIRNALIGYHNEVTPILHDMLFRLRGEDVSIGVTSVAKVLVKQ
ncbi:MAG: beta-ketoacyl synthase chain length factor [Paraprevotella sp.]|nr:beta-ketoacyl synthase chain length factor [Paraprevotella sp.]